MGEFKQGEEIEVSGKNASVWLKRKFIAFHGGIYHCENKRYPNSPLCQWRQARAITKPKLVPYTADTFPKTTILVRRKSLDGWWSVSGIDRGCIYFLKEAVSWASFLDLFLVSLDHGKTWQPAGEMK